MSALAIERHINEFANGVAHSAYVKKHGNIWRAANAHIEELRKSVKWNPGMLAPWQAWMRVAMFICAGLIRIGGEYVLDESGRLPFGEAMDRYMRLCHKLEMDPRVLYKAAMRLHLFHSWRMAKDIVKFDVDAIGEFEKCGVDADISANLFFSMPAWAIWFDAPGIKIGERAYDGFLAGMLYGETDGDFDAGIDKNPYLSLLFLQANEPMMSESIMLSLTGDSLKEVINNGIKAENTEIEALTELANAETSQRGRDYRLRLAETGKEKTNIMREYLDSGSGGLACAISMIAYVCSYGFHDRVDYKPGSDFHLVLPKKTKKGFRLFAAQQPTVWEMGREIGEAIRKAAAYCRLDHPGLGSAKRPHMRRGHWRNQQCGPRSNPFHKPLFIPPMFIRGNMPDGDIPEAS